jgi:hypothetical protein
MLTKTNRSPRLEGFPLRCEVCRTAVLNAFFSPKSLETFKQTDVPEVLSKQYNYTMSDMVQAACGAELFQAPPRRDEPNVKIKGLFCCLTCFILKEPKARFFYV